MSKQNRKFEANQARLDAIRSKVEESELAQSQIKNDLFNPVSSCCIFIQAKELLLNWFYIKLYSNPILTTLL